MTLNLYVMPVVLITGPHGPTIQPKYQASVFPTLHPAFDTYGDEPWCLVSMINIDGPTNTALNAEPDVFALPSNLDQVLTAPQRNRASSALESANIPGTWLTTANTWRDVALFVGALCQYIQMYGAQGGTSLFTGGVTLATTFGSLPGPAAAALLAAASAFHFDISQLVGSTTLRQLLRNVGQQYLAAGIPLDEGQGVSLYTA